MVISSEGKLFYSVGLVTVIFCYAEFANFKWQVGQHTQPSVKETSLLRMHFVQQGRKEIQMETYIMEFVLTWHTKFRQLAPSVRISGIGYTKTIKWHRSTICYTLVFSLFCLILMFGLERCNQVLLVSFCLEHRENDLFWKSDKKKSAGHFKAKSLIF